MATQSESKSISIITHALGIFTGFLVPLIIFLVTQDKTVKEHSKKALNWQLSLLIYSAISFVLIFLLIGFILLPILALLNLIFCIIAAIKANDGELWNYPLSIPFFK